MSIFHKFAFERAPRFALIALVATVLANLSPPALAYDVGDVAYLCKKNQKFVWVFGSDSWSACPVRVVRRAGSSYKVLAHQRSCLLPGFGGGMISKGREAWVESSDLWYSRSSCEGRGKRAKTSQFRDQRIYITNKCSFDISGFVYYENLSGKWTKGKSFTIPADGKTYKAWDAKTNNTIVDYYIYNTKTKAVIGKKNGVTRPHNDEKVRLSRFTARRLPVEMVFCKTR